ncbi:MAG: leucine--tRNA ligase [Candidatus Marsarchaeota archaeon]|nr:leucine--tRNA ligase [Candidatus Marsarchaeota archaeon]MCL5095010.1 leucine--tRNA ligase [Candidatus Marsarchaeota archaeon]
MIDYKEIEEKWQNQWAENKLFEPEVSENKSLLVTAAFPYVNMPQTIGHLRTYGTTDVYARYMRLRGFNVLFPMGFHVTGTPIIAIAKRLQNNDKELIETLKMFDIPDAEIKKMQDPYYIAEYFIKITEKGMKRAGYSIDWRRKFNSIDPLFSKMIEWQFLKLKEKDLLIQGSHPLGWCPNENNAVGQHDTMHDIQPEIEKITAIKFKSSNEDIYFICATYRPETLYGVTNLFINKNEKYVIAKINNEKYYLARQSAENLSNQIKLSIEMEISVDELINKHAVNPINSKEVPIFNGFFVKPNVGTGIVMSVPSHAPFDYVALEDLKKKGVVNKEIKYEKLIGIEPHQQANLNKLLDKKHEAEINNSIPALNYLNIVMSEKSTVDFTDEIIEEATKLAYKEESHFGIMLVGKYKGQKEAYARDAIKQDLINENNAFEIYIIANNDNVVCRCGSKIIIKMIQNQWFINYGNEEWKSKVKQDFKNIKIFPPILKSSFEAAIDWINLRATERAQGLGTPFPFNKDHIIESLSDSTIYMVFYTFLHLLRQNKIQAEQLKPEFFDFVFHNSGEIKDISSKTGIDIEVIKKCRESFNYWYSGLTSRHSGGDLVPSHLTMYIFNHIALFEKQYWVKQIIINGLVFYEGQKMSKSLGNIIPLIKGIDMFGADPIRFLEIATANLDSDNDFSSKAIDGIKSKIEFFSDTIQKLESLNADQLKHIDFWLYSKLNSKIKVSTELFDSMLFRDAYNEIFYNTISELKWYFERGGSNQIVVRDVLENAIIMLSPVMPHISEEFWRMLGKNNFIVRQKWPAANESMINSDIEYIENIFINSLPDINKAIELSSKISSNSDKKLKQIKIIISNDWKTKYFNKLAESKSLSNVLSDAKDMQKDKLGKFLSQFANKLNALRPVPDINSKQVFEVFEDAKGFLASRFNTSVLIEYEKDSTSQRAFRSFINKPGIDLIWA